MQGRTVLDQKATSTTGITTFDVHDLPAGLYQVQLFDGQKLTTQRLQKE
nr:T9SS type A sorting domain-containing protein [Hymenobacter rubidus]